MQPVVVGLLRCLGHEVYDFRNPEEGVAGFSWSEVDPDWQSWTPEKFVDVGLQHDAALRGYRLDWRAMRWADTCVLLLPCGKSAHLEAGYFVGAGKDLVICLEDKGACEPELMYNLARRVVVGRSELRSEFSTE